MCSGPFEIVVLFSLMKTFVRKKYYRQDVAVSEKKLGDATDLDVFGGYLWAVRVGILYGEIVGRERHHVSRALLPSGLGRPPDVGVEVIGDSVGSPLSSHPRRRVL